METGEKLHGTDLPRAIFSMQPHGMPFAIN
jgi:hypothetical protein